MERSKGIWYNNIPREKWTAEFPETSIYEQMRTNAQQYLDYPAIEFQNKKYSYRELIRTVETLAKSLLSIGIKKGDKVSIISPNTPQGVFMFYAVNRIGAVANMIHPLLSTNEIQQFIESTESSAVFTVDVVYNKIAPITWTFEKAPKVIIAKVIDALPLYLKPLFALKSKKKLDLNPSHDSIYWNDLMKLADSCNVDLPQVNPEDLAVILYSGGTTGVQKGVMLSNYNITCYAIQAFEASGMETLGKRCLTVLPLFHGFGLALCVHTMLICGACIFLVPVYDFNKCNSLIFKKKLNFLCGVPAFFETLSRYPKIESEDLSFIDCLISGGDVLPKKLQNRINQQLKNGGSKAIIREAYGQTESVTGCCINPDFNNIIGSVGLPCPDIESKVVALGTCDEVPNGTEGELCLSGPNIMLGYYNNEDATRKVLKKHTDGKIWLHTGDIFYKQDDGYLFFRQRLSRMIVCAGYNVYLSQIEEALTDCSIIENCCAVGIDDKVLGSKVGLYVILNKDIPEVDATEIIKNHCKKNLAEFAIPSQIIYVKDFPQTKMGKTDFVLLEKRINKR